MHKHFEKTGTRQSYRLQCYDYGEIGKYYITICTNRSQHLFGSIYQHEMLLNDLGHATMRSWETVTRYFPNACMDTFVIMPNHIHGIIEIYDKIKPNEVKHGTSQSLGSIVRAFKSNVTKWSRQHTNIHEVWQRNYYEHIIKNEVDYARISEYIINNPQNWDKDHLNNVHS